MGGGTAGHLFPSVAVAQRLVDDMGAEVLFIGAQGRLDRRILSEQGMAFELIPARPFPYGVSLAAARAMWALYRSIRRCRKILREFRPDVAFGSGGYVSVAGVIAASQLGIPSVCHASDAQPDRANRLLARWATRITTHFEVAAASFAPEKTTVVGQPVRKAFAKITREDARAALGIPWDAFVLLVSGGSQGARTLNHATAGALGNILEDPATHVVHFTGALDIDEVQARTAGVVGRERYHCQEFCETPWVPIAAADLCLTRGGASSVAEVSLLGVPMIIVPYPYAAAHQKLNAEPFAQAGAALVIDNADLTADRLALEVERLRSSPETLRRMSDAARSVSRPDAADRIAAIIAELAGTTVNREWG